MNNPFAATYAQRDIDLERRTNQLAQQDAIQSKSVFVTGYDSANGVYLVSVDGAIMPCRSLTNGAIETGQAVSLSKVSAGTGFIVSMPN